MLDGADKPGPQPGTQSGSQLIERKLATILWHMLRQRRTYAECRSLAEGGAQEKEKQECG